MEQNSGPVLEEKLKIAKSEQTFTDSKAQMEHLRSLEARICFLEKQLRRAEGIITELVTSTSWRLTKPIRIICSLFTNKLFQKDGKGAFGNSFEKTNVPLDAKCEEPKKAVSELSAIEAKFDPEFYRKAYPDTVGLDPWYHFSKFGKDEGRFACAEDGYISYDIRGIDRSRDTVLIVCHEATRTGAPILALNIIQGLRKKYNVIVLLLKGGRIFTEFEKNCEIVLHPFQKGFTQYTVSLFLESLLNEVELKFAIVNSIESRFALPALANYFVPSLCLIHEFASTRPNRAIFDVVLYASEVIFSADIVHQDALEICEALKIRRKIILPQGRCIVPPNNSVTEDDKERQRIRKLFRPEFLADDAIVILGAGSVEFRKGVDLFIACAARVKAFCPANDFRFVWVGHGFDPENDKAYSAYLQDQIHRTSLEGHVCFVGELYDIEKAYMLSDVLFLGSRLDPLPNVAIDAMFHKLPVICFDGTSGIAEILQHNGLGHDCVVSYLDIEQAAQKLVGLINSQEQRIKIGQHCKDLAQKLFDMKLYVESLERHALNCSAMQEAEKKECRIIEEDGVLNHSYYAQPAWSTMPYKETVRAFVRTWKSGIDLRKPFPGFHPGIYEDLHGVSSPQRNPLVDFFENNKPAGPWLCELIQPLSSIENIDKKKFKTALHIHVFYVELFGELFNRLENQTLQLDLLISVPSQEVAEKIHWMVEGYLRGSIDIRIVPNRGRDLGPLLTEYRETILNDYEIIGHLHTKKTSDVKDAAIGQIWYKFLLDNLIGKEYPMASIILERFATIENLGLVFPDDPFAIGWTQNKNIAKTLAHQMGITELPDRYFNFPVGSMFWARTEALKPLFTKNFKWEDYPEEPVSYDGTVLHAIERLLPVVSKKMGYQTMMTHVPGITR